MSSSETYKMTYLSHRGMAEPIRLMFAYAGVKYTDERLTHESLPARKPELPWGTLPVLEVRPGKSETTFVLAQVAAIGRYLAKKFDLDAKTEEAAAKCDEYVDAVKDFGQEFVNWVKFSDEDAKAAQILEIREKHAPHYFAKFEAILSKNGAGWLVGNRMTWADIFAANHLYNWAKFLGDGNMDGFNRDFPNITKLTENVFAHEGIAKWIKERPDTPF